MARRDIAARLLGRAGLVRALAAVRGRLFGSVTLLAYHRVLDVADEATFPFDLELVSASTADFAAQMAYVKAHYTPITFAALLERLDRGAALPPRPAIVTFDDGFADNYEHAFPILRRLGMPATIFLATGYLDSRAHYWYEQLTYAVMTTTADSVELAPTGRLALASRPERRDAVKALLRAMKQAPDDRRLEWLRDLQARLPAHPGPADARSGPMTWEQVREMSAAGIEFGSHTVTHPVLSKVGADKLSEELRASRRRIEAETGKPVQVIAYPVGGEEAFNDDVRSAVRAAGYRLGVSYISGLESPASWDPLALRRVHVERYVDGPLFEAILAAPELFDR